jgi:N-acetyl-alpha-D-muramate 1-phosphate uridylyltransferase
MSITEAPITEAMLMAAGLGTRMRPLTNDRPKPLVDIAGKPMIDHVMAALARAGVTHAVVNVHYLPDLLTAHLGDESQGVRVSISDESDLLLETGGGLVKAAPLLSTDAFYCVNSDNIWTEEGQENGGAALSRLAAAWDADAMDALLLLIPHARAHNHRGRGDFHCAEDGTLTRRGQLADGQSEHAPFIFTGVQILHRRLLVGAPEGPFSTNVLWDRALSNGRLFGLEHAGHWFDVGTPEAIAPTEEFLAAAGPAAQMGA